MNALRHPFLIMRRTLDWFWSGSAFTIMYLLSSVTRSGPQLGTSARSLSS